MKSTKSKKIILFASAIAVLLITSAIIVGTFIKIQNKIRHQMLHNYMEQINELSFQVINTIHLEVEYSAHFLKCLAETLDINNSSNKENIDALKKLKHKGNFQTLGIINSNGDYFDTDGNYYKINFKNFTEKLNLLENNESYYISDVIKENGKKAKEILIAVPVCKEEKIDEFLFGYYPIMEITEEISIIEKNHRFFKLIDTNGNYISRPSNNKSIIERKESIWEEMKEFIFLNGRTLEEVKKNIADGKNGVFAFDYNGYRRYVSYSPLKINNWYVFSVFTRDELDSRAKEFQKITSELLFYMINFKIALIAVIMGIVIYIYYIIEKQSKDIEIKNKMFKMLAGKTKDIFFEIHSAEKKFILYNYTKENSEVALSLEEVSPENMLAKDYINKENFLLYKELYNNVLEKQNIDNFIVHLKLSNTWKWFRINSAAFSSGHTIGILEDFTEEKNQELEFLKISEKSKYDFLTQLYNRETFEKEFNDFLNSRDNSKENFDALFLIDLDNFKEINDVFGHRMGDKVLHEAAGTLKHSLRSSDLLGRLGGDEFILLIKNAPNIEAIHKIAQKLNSSLTKTYTRNNKSISISCSIGISIIDTDFSFKKAYKNADKALYHVKYNGRNSYFINK